MSAVKRLARLEERASDAELNLAFCRATRDRMQHDHEAKVARLADTEAMLAAEIDTLRAELPVARGEAEAEIRAAEIAAAAAELEELEAEVRREIERDLRISALRELIDGPTKGAQS